MNQKLSKKFRLTTEQVQVLASIADLVQQLQLEANTAALGRKFGTSKQLIQYHINQKKGKHE